MTPDEITQALLGGTLTKENAIAQLVELGYLEADARELVFIALGGDDVVQDDVQRAKNIQASRKQ